MSFISPIFSPTLSLNVSVFHRMYPFLVYSTGMLLVFPHAQALIGGIWWLRGGLSVSRAVCAPSNTAIKTHILYTNTATFLPPSAHKPEQVWLITLHNHLLPWLPLPRSQSLSLTPSGLIPEFVLKLLSSSSIPCFLGFSQVSNPISPSTQSQQVWINCQAT